MKEKPDYFNSLRMAFGFLTVLPVPQKKEWSERDFGLSALFYPLAGAAVGACAGAAFILLSRVFQKPLAAFLTLGIWILLSGGLHWDGLADCMDGFCCSAEPSRRLEIMKDPRLGTFGALGVFCCLMVKWLCLWNMPQERGILFYVMTAASARWAFLFLIRMPAANPDGLAAMLQKHCPRHAALYAAPLPLLASFFCGGLSGLLYPAVNVLWIWLVSRLALRKIGGISGDVLGFGIETGEILILLAGQVLP